MRKKRKSISKAGKLLCLMLAVVLTLGAMPVYGTFASAGTDDPTVETASETPAPSVEPDTPEPAAAPQGEPEATLTPSAEVTPSGEPEASPTPGETPTESPEPENTTYANSISGVLWIDVDENGIYDSGESPLADYPVYLYLEGDTDNAVQMTATDADGKYLFEGMTPGRYVVGIKAEENGTEYLLPLMGVQQDNKFYFTADYSKVISNPIDIAADTAVEDMDVAMRNRPGIQPMAGPYVSEIDVGAATTAITISTSGTYRLYGTTTSNTRYITVANGVTAIFDLDGVSMTCSTSPIRLIGTANVTLALIDGTTNTFTCTSSASVVNTVAAGIYVHPNATLIIDGTGTVNVKGGSYCAGIGGIFTTNSGTSDSNGTVIVNSGTVNATSGSYAPGIGGGYRGPCGTITITGGTVNAIAAERNGSPGIGCGQNTPVGSGGIITISGGQVSATGGNNLSTIISPGIGSYMDTISIGTVIFTGGSIYSTNYSGTVSVYPNPTNGSIYGAPDPVGMITFPGYSSGDAFSIMAGGTVSSYLYEANAHPDGKVYAWLAHPGVSTEAATNVTANSAMLNGTYYMNGTSISSAYFEWGTYPIQHNVGCY